jgi:mRNA interferase RelE/StbE
MKYRVVFAPEALDDFRALRARVRAEVRDAIVRHLMQQPTQVSRSRIKRLRATRRPQYRLRVGDVRIFYDVIEDTVEVLAIVEKAKASAWLEEMGDD